MRKWIAALLALALVLAAGRLRAGCGAGLGPNGGTPSPAPSSDGDGRLVTASTVDELLSAIASDTVITLSPGKYDLTSAADYGAAASGNYAWSEVYDGYELKLSNIKNVYTSKSHRNVFIFQNIEMRIAKLG